MSHPAVETSSARTWLADLDRAFAAASAGDPHSVLLSLFSRRVRLRLIGSALRERVLPAFAHLILLEDQKPAELTINLWHGTAHSPPPPPWPQSSYVARSEIRHGFTDDALQLSFQIESGTLEVFAAEQGRAYCWVRDVASWPLWQSAAPLRTTLGHFARHVRGQLVHGAAVGTAEGAVLLSARGGSGKSTTALACLEASLLYLGDDYVYLNQALPRRVFSIYATAKLRPEGSLWNAKLGAAAWQHQPGEAKSVLYLHPSFREQLVTSLPLRAVLIPTLSPGATTRLQPASAKEALLALAPTTVFQLPGSDSTVLSALSQLVRDVPIYRLELGPQPAAAAAVIKKLLSAESAGELEEIRDAAK